MCYNPQVHAGRKTGIAGNSFQAVQNQFFLLGDNNSNKLAL